MYQIIHTLYSANYVEWRVGDLCEALYKEDNKYYPGKPNIFSLLLAIIHKLDDFQIDVTVFYIGYNSSAMLDMSEIRKPTTRWDVADRLPEKDIRVLNLNAMVNQAGTKCRVIFHGDGNFYDTIIESVVGDEVNIRYTKFNTYDTVRKSDLKQIFSHSSMSRIAVKAVEQKPEDELKILPTDDKKTVNMKKKKVGKIHPLNSSST